MEVAEHLSFDPRIWAAIVTSVVSLLVALFGFIEGRKSRKESADQQKKLEVLKANLSLELEKEREKILSSIEVQRLRSVLLSEELKKKIDALSKFISHIQELKETLYVAVNSRPEDIDYYDLANSYKSAHENFNQEYRNLLSHLDNEENEILHRLKNSSDQIKRQIINLPEEHRVGRNYLFQLKEWRNTLIDEQNRLRDIRSDKFNEV